MSDMKNTKKHTRYFKGALNNAHYEVEQRFNNSTYPGQLFFWKDTPTGKQLVGSYHDAYGVDKWDADLNDLAFMDAYTGILQTLGKAEAELISNTLKF